MNNKLISTIMYVASAILNVVGIITLVGGNADGTGFVWICVGSSLLCLGSALSRRGQDDKKEQ